MQWAIPEHSKKAVNRAAKMLLAEPPVEVYEYVDAIDVINNWRASHSFPLNTFQNNLRRKANSINNDCIIAQRIKRLPSIVSKLRRYPSMTLSQMQDIGRCRAILKTSSDVSILVNAYKKSDIKHELHHTDDYILNPKPSGYRGVHMIYRYKSDRKATYNSLLIELQIRSFAQHAWATAVETVGTFVGQALKSSIGEAAWLRFFCLMGSGIANLEGTPPVPGTPDDINNLALEILASVDELDIFRRLSDYSNALNVIELYSTRSNHFFLIELDSVNKETTISPFPFGQSQLATAEYNRIEEKVKDHPGSDAVLVSVDSITQLRKAYPNYFADTHTFINLINDILEKGGQRRSVDVR